MDRSNDPQGARGGKSPAGVSRRDFAALGLAGAGALLAETALPSPAMAQAAAPGSGPVEPTRLVSAGETLRPEIVGEHGIVAAGRHYAVMAGTRMLLAGGNATDAGVAAVFAAAVTEISHFGFGGEGPTIIYDKATARVSVINGQGTAPGLATPARFAKAGVIPGNGPDGGTVPAMVDAMCRALALNGTMPLHEVLKPAIELADGFVMYNFLAEVFASQKKATSRYKTAYDTYYPGGKGRSRGRCSASPTWPGRSAPSPRRARPRCAAPATARPRSWPGAMPSTRATSPGGSARR
jgi:gamma-glutamyltranspeptidase/glutathione hydrolase